jgi:hypothetical protein
MGVSCEMIHWIVYFSKIEMQIDWRALLRKRLHMCGEARQISLVTSLTSTSIYFQRNSSSRERTWMNSKWFKLTRIGITFRFQTQHTWKRSPDEFFHRVFYFKPYLITSSHNHSMIKLSQDRITDELTISKNILMKRGTLWIISMNHRKIRPEKTRDLRNLVLEKNAKDQRDG